MHDRDNCDSPTTIGHFGKYHNTLCLCPQFSHEHCFQFLLGLTTVSRENKNNAYAKFGGTNKEYYVIFRSGLYVSWIYLGLNSKRTIVGGSHQEVLPRSSAQHCCYECFDFDLRLAPKMTRFYKINPSSFCTCCMRGYVNFRTF